MILVTVTHKYKIAAHYFLPTPAIINTQISTYSETVVTNIWKYKKNSLFLELQLKTTMIIIPSLFHDKDKETLQANITI
jgi:hypothetical protein